MHCNLCDCDAVLIYWRVDIKKKFNLEGVGATGITILGGQADKVVL